MIAVDTNILVYAHRRDSEWHKAAAKCMRQLAEGREAWAIAWPCIHEFLAIVTHQKIYSPPSPPELALDQIKAWTESPSLVTIGETSQHLLHIGQLVLSGKITGARVHDARVAALCIQHDVSELWSADRDFSRFSKLKVRNPLAG